MVRISCRRAVTIATGVLSSVHKVQFSSCLTAKRLKGKDSSCQIGLFIKLKFFANYSRCIMSFAWLTL